MYMLNFDCACLRFWLKKTTLVSDEELVHANNMMHVT